MIMMPLNESFVSISIRVLSDNTPPIYRLVWLQNHPIRSLPPSVSSVRTALDRQIFSTQLIERTNRLVLPPRLARLHLFAAQKLGGGALENDNFRVLYWLRNLVCKTCHRPLWLCGSAHWRYVALETDLESEFCIYDWQDRAYQCSHHRGGSVIIGALWDLQNER